MCADLGLAYREMGCVPDALDAWVRAVAGHIAYAPNLGPFILDNLSPFGWGRFASGVCR